MKQFVFDKLDKMPRYMFWRLMFTGLAMFWAAAIFGIFLVIDYLD